MSFSKLLKVRENTEELLAEERDRLNSEMLQLHDQLDIYNSDAWAHVEAILMEEQRQAFTDMMHGEGDQILFARERAKLISRLINRRKDLETDLSRLRVERDALEE